MLIGILIILLSLKQCKSSFSSITLPDVSNENAIVGNSDIYNVTNFDTRYTFPYNPPVNPMIMNTLLVNKIQGSSELFGETADNLLDDQELIKIPLQFNDPYNEQLRSQNVLITPYNRIKYSTKSSCGTH